MFNPRCISCRTARPSKSGGFTLVELLVVIGIIAILAGVALGPITIAIKKGKESAAVQESHAIGLAMYSFANDNQQLYPDSSNPSGNTGGATAAAAARALLNGGYVSDPSIFFITGDASGSKYTGTVASAATQIAQTNISWDFAGVSAGTGLSSVNYPWLPVLWSTVSGGTEPTLTAAPGTAITAVTVTANPFGTAGSAVFYESNAASFVTANSGTVTMVTGPNVGGTATGASVLPGM